jgi:hypothetical protein
MACRGAEASLWSGRGSWSSDLKMQAHSYALEQLYRDQHRDWVVDAIPPVLAWLLPAKSRRVGPPFLFKVEHSVLGQPSRQCSIALDWDVGALQLEDSDVLCRSSRMRSGRTVFNEHLPELAAYGLALVAISVLMPGRRVIHKNIGSAPDLLFDVTPMALRGVEVAGRTSGGLAALRGVRDGQPASSRADARTGKKAQLIARVDVAECHLSLWCASSLVAFQEQVK